MKSKMMRSTMMVLMLMIGSALLAQPPGGGGGQGSGTPPPAGATGAPIDGGSVAFLAGVVGYVYTQLKQQQSKK